VKLSFISFLKSVSLLMTALTALPPVAGRAPKRSAVTPPIARSESQPARVPAAR